MHRTITFALAILLGFAPALTRAAVTNGGFETADYTGWTLTGQGAVQTASIGVTPTEGTHQAFIDTTGNYTVTAPFVASALGVSGPTIIGLGQGTPVNGTALTQSITVNAGDVLSFDWDFASDELNEAATYNDFVFFTIDSSAYLLASRNTSTFDLVSPPPGYDGQTDWATQTYTFTTGGTYTLGFAILNVGDAGHDSALFVDHVKLPTSVPEPGSTVILMLSSAAMISRRSRHAR